MGYNTYIAINSVGLVLPDMEDNMCGNCMELENLYLYMQVDMENYHIPLQNIL